MLCLKPYSVPNFLKAVFSHLIFFFHLPLRFVKTSISVGTSDIENGVVRDLDYYLTMYSIVYIVRGWRPIPTEYAFGNPTKGKSGGSRIIILVAVFIWWILLLHALKDVKPPTNQGANNHYDKHEKRAARTHTDSASVGGFTGCFCSDNGRLLPLLFW